MSRVSQAVRPLQARTRLILAAIGGAAILTTACAQDAPFAPPVEPPSTPDVLGLVEVTISGFGADAHASAISAPDVASLARLRSAPPMNGGVALFDMETPRNFDISGDGTIQLEPLATGSFTDGARGVDGVRYVYATFRVRNAQADGVAYDTQRQNLTFLAAAHDGTLEETALSGVYRFDGSAVAPGVAASIVPSGSVRRAAGDAAIEPHTIGVLQVLTEDEADDVLGIADDDVTTVFPYGFVVSNPSTPGSRILAENPAADQFDGVVTFAFKVPLQANQADDAYSITAVFVAVDDTETRVTESVEEQGTSSAQTAADALGSAGVTLLGNSSTAIVGHGTRRICRVRTAGLDGANPSATLVDAGGSCTAGAIALPAGVRVVDDDAAPGGDGTAWASAFRYLQDAMACARDESGPGGACEDVTEIWVAGGTYFPDEGAGQTDGSASARFTLIEGVSLYGGFAGGEYARDQRPGQVSVIDGDVNGDGSLTGNSTVLITTDPASIVTRATVVDGFTLRGIAPATDAGAIYCRAEVAGECSPTLRNLLLPNIVSVNGAAYIVALQGGVTEPLFDDVTFAYGVASSTNFGGGAALVVASGGSARAAPVFLNSLFLENEGIVAGAILAYGFLAEVDVTVANSQFRNNTATGTDAGTIVLDVQVNGVGSTDIGLRVLDSEMWSNNAAGGAVINAVDAVTVEIAGSTIAGNTADAAVRMTDPGSLTILNTIIHSNSGTSLNAVAGLDFGAGRNSIIEGGCIAALATCVDVFDTDPQFEDLAAGYLWPSGTSLAVNAGSNAHVPNDAFDLDADGDTVEPVPYDVMGRRRVVDYGGGNATAIVDIGAHERQ